MCGSVRGVPESSIQRFPAGTPHVGQGTEDDCLSVSSFFFIRTEYDNTQPRKRSVLYTVGISCLLDESKLDQLLISGTKRACRKLAERGVTDRNRPHFSQLCEMGQHGFLSRCQN